MKLGAESRLAGEARGAGRARGLFLVLCGAVALAGCGVTNGADVFGNLLAFNSVSAPPVGAAAPHVVKVDCPTVSVDDNGGTLRVYAGAAQSSGTVRYQLDVSQYARECRVENGELAIKVGVQGRAILGPAGEAGAVVAPIRIAIERQSDNQIVAQKIYRTDVAIPPGAGETMFETVSDPLIVPFTRQQADQDYTVLVGFEQPSAAAAPARHVPRRKKRT